MFQPRPLDLLSHLLLLSLFMKNVAFYSFALFALGQMFVAISIARSQAMIADSCAMVIDSLTYLFNSWAERIKNRSLLNNEEHDSSEREKEIKRLERTRQRLLLEIAPPLCSVLTLIGLTVSVSKEAVDTLTADVSNSEENQEAASCSDDPNVATMFFFSGLNLALDILNVTCFARARHAFGFAVIDEDRHRYMLAYDGSLHNVYADSLRTRSEADLLRLDTEEEGINQNEKHKNYSSVMEGREDKSLDINQESVGFQEVNLNMCSAYTVSDVISIYLRGSFFTSKYQLMFNILCLETAACICRYTSEHSCIASSRHILHIQHWRTSHGRCNSSTSRKFHHFDEYRAFVKRNISCMGPVKTAIRNQTTYHSS